MCGICHKDNFNISTLHDPLRKIFVPVFDREEWVETYSELINGICYFDEDCSEWFWPPDLTTTLLRCIMHVNCVDSCTFSEWLESNLPTLLNIIEKNEVISEFLDDDEKSYLRAGKCSISGIEIEAISIKENWNIKVINLDKECVKIDEFFYTVESPKKEITIINAEGYFGIKI